MQGAQTYRGLVLPPQSPPRTTPTRRHALPREMTDTLQNLSNTLVYLWLREGRGFWYYLARQERGILRGYAWSGRRWLRRDLARTVIWSYY